MLVQVWQVRIVVMVLCKSMWMVLKVLVNIFCRREVVCPRVGVVGESECVQVWVYVWWCLCLGIALAWGHHTNLFPPPSPSSPPAYQVDITDHRPWFHTCTSS